MCDLTGAFFESQNFLLTSYFLLCESWVLLLWLHIVAGWFLHTISLNTEVFLKKAENIHYFFEKGIDFMENLRYNWTVRERNT